MNLKQFFAGVLTAVLAMGSMMARAEVTAESEEGFLDLTIGDRVAKEAEALVVNPAWGDVEAAELLIDGEADARSFSSASVEAWETASLEPGRYVVALEAGELVEQAAFWKLGEDWVVLDNETITENVTFESGKTYLVFGTNLIASGVTLTVTDGAKFFYDESAPAGFQTAGGSLNELPKRYKIADGLDPADGTKFYQIVEKIHGCEDNPWAIGAEGEVVAWTNGTELVVAGAGTIGALDENAELAALLDGLTGLTIVDADVTVGADALAALAGDASVALTLPDGWQGELPDQDGNWYGAQAELTAVPLAVKNVAFKQYWPWKGQVDVSCTLTGPAGEQNVIVTAFTNGTEKIASFTTRLTIPESGVVNDARVVWNATDLGADFKADDLTVEVAIAETEPVIAAASDAGTVDVRTNIALAEGETMVPGVMWSEDCWGMLEKAPVTISYLSETSDEEGDLATDLAGTGVMEVSLPKKDGVYRLKHSVGELTTFVTFTVSGYPLGCETNPWLAGEGVYVTINEALTNRAAVVIDAGLPETAREIDTAAFAKGFEVGGYEPLVTPVNAFLVTEEKGETLYVKPANWLDADDPSAAPYATLADALAAGVAAVLPNVDEIPAEIARMGVGADGKTYTATQVNESGEGEANLRAFEVEGLLEAATANARNLTLFVSTKDAEDVDAAQAAELAAANTNGVADVIDYRADYVDLTAFADDAELATFDDVVTLHLPWTKNDRQVYRVSRIGAGAASAFPIGADNAVDGEYAEFGEDEIVLHVKTLACYAIAEITLQPRYSVVVGNASKKLGEADPTAFVTNFTVNVQGLAINPEDIRGYCVRANGEGTGDYPINFVCTSLPEGFDGEFVEIPGVFTIEPQEEIEDIEAECIGKVALTATALEVESKSKVTAKLQGLPSGLKFDAKTLAISGTPKKDGTYTVKVSLKNAAGYTYKQSFLVTVAEGAVADVLAGDDVERTGVALALSCDETKGQMKGAGVYALAYNKKLGIMSKSVTVSATPAKGYVFAGWYMDAGYTTPANVLLENKNGKVRDYRESYQLIVLTEPTILYARFVAATTKADPITWLRYAGAGYCGADAGYLAETETWYQGVALPTNGCTVVFDSLSLPTVSVKGLPSGVKFDSSTNRFTGAPTKAGVFTVVISVKNKSGATDKLEKTVEVAELPAWMVGNFDGFHAVEGQPTGTLTATVAAKTGKISGKIVGGLRAGSFAAASFADVTRTEDGSLVYSADVVVKACDPETAKTVQTTNRLVFAENAVTGLGVIGGEIGNGRTVEAVQRAWSRKDLTFPTFTTKPGVTLDLGNGATLKFGAKGVVKVAGIVDGAVVTGSTYVLPATWSKEDPLVLTAQTVVYGAPKKSIGTAFCAVYDLVFTVDEAGNVTAVQRPDL